MQSTIKLVRITRNKGISSHKIPQNFTRFTFSLDDNNCKSSNKYSHPLG